MKTLTFYLVGLLGVVILSGCSQQIALFNGQDLDGWEMYLKDEKVDPATVWSVRDGVLRCEGQPFGYIRTAKSYSNYVLELEWRWPEKPTNSGVLLHTVGEEKIWPQCIEAQLKHENAGDFVTIQAGSAITVNGERHTSTDKKLFTIIPKQNDSTENLPGQWNSYNIICKDDTIQLTVNGVLQNTATETTLTSGAICLQSEGSPIEFRNIMMTPLK